MTRLRGVALMAAMAAAAACGRPDSAEKTVAAAPVSVSLVTVAAQQVPEILEAGGIVRPRLTATLSSRVVAPVVQVSVRPGDRVRAGQVVVALDQRQVEADAERAEAMLDAARRAATGARADNSAAAAALSLARKTHERIASLSVTRSATAQELDEAASAVAAAEARLNGAEARVAEADAAVVAAGRGHESARIARTYSTLTAPFNGVVSTRAVDPGTLASPGTPLLTIEADDTFRLETTIDESRAGFLEIGAPVQVVVDQLEPGLLEGRVDEMARSVDAASHAVTVKIALPHAAGLRSGMFGRARFSGKRAAALIIPASSVVRHGQLTFVYVSDHGVARLRLVRVSPAAADQLAVTSGLAAGESIVRTPPASLADGRPLAQGSGK